MAACGVRVASTATGRVEPVRQRRPFEALAVNVAATPAIVERCPRRNGDGVLLRADVHPSMRHAAPTRRDPRRPDRLQPARSATPIRRRFASAVACASRAARARGARGWPSRHRAGLVVTAPTPDGISTTDTQVSGRDGAVTRSRCTPRLQRGPRRMPPTSREATPAKLGHCPAVRAGEPGRPVTSCCSTRRHHMLIAGTSAAITEGLRWRACARPRGPLPRCARAARPGVERDSGAAAT